MERMKSDIKKRILLGAAAALACTAFSLGAVAEGLSPTTGKATERPYKPVMVNLDNEPGARPQIGLAAADVVYEMVLYEGGYTRYTAVYNDRLPEYVEGVRSARICHVDLYSDWGGAFVFNGVQERRARTHTNTSRRGIPSCRRGMESRARLFMPATKAAKARITYVLRSRRRWNP